VTPALTRPILARAGMTKRILYRVDKNTLFKSESLGVPAPDRCQRKKGINNPFDFITT
jgi:hypothetical protein